MDNTMSEDILKENDNNLKSALKKIMPIQNIPHSLEFSINHVINDTIERKRNSRLKSISFFTIGASVASIFFVVWFIFSEFFVANNANNMPIVAYDVVRIFKNFSDTTIGKTYNKNEVIAFLSEKIPFIKDSKDRLINSPISNPKAITIADISAGYLEYNINNLKVGHFIININGGCTCNNGKTECNKCSETCKMSCQGIDNTIKTFRHENFSIITYLSKCGCGHVIISQTEDTEKLLKLFSNVLREEKS